MSSTAISYPAFTWAPPPAKRPVSGMTAPTRTVLAGAPALPCASVLNSRPATISVANRRMPSHLRTSVPLSPDFSGCLHDQPEFRPLILFGEQVSLHRGCESTLRTERQILQRYAARRLVDPPDQVLFRFELRTLAAHQTEDNGLASRDEPQRLERARACVIVFEQEAIHLQRAEEFLRDRIISALRVPLAAIVAAAQVDRQRRARAFGARETGVVRLDSLIQRRIRLNAHLILDVIPPLWIDIVAIPGRVDLNVLYSLCNKRPDLRLHNRNDVPQQSGMVPVHLVCNAFLEGNRRELVGGGQSDLYRSWALGLEE